MNNFNFQHGHGYLAREEKEKIALVNITSRKFTIMKITLKLVLQSDIK